MTAHGAPLRLVVCSTGIPHAHTHARLSASLMILYSYLAELKKRGVTILHVLVLDRNEKKEDLLAAYAKEMASPGIFDVVPVFVDSLLMPRERSTQKLRAIHPPRETVKAIEDFKPDVIFCFEMLSGAIFQDVTTAPKILQVHDPKFTGMWYHTLYGLKENPLTILSLPLNWLRARQWKTFYLSAMKKFSRVHTVVASSGEVLTKLGVPCRYIPFPWPKLSSKKTDRSSRASLPTFLFLGNLSGLGSRSALHFLFDKIYPELLALWGSGKFSILICGAQKAPQWILDEIHKRPEMKFLGFVEDIDALMRECHGVIAPMDVKTGNRSRIVTAMSLRVPVVAHGNTALGNPALVDGVTCLLASDGKTFARHMKTVAEHPKEISAMIDRAEKLYEEQFEPAHATNFLLEEITAALQHD